jgi:hypothetical protein
MKKLADERFFYHIFGMNIESCLPFLNIPERKGIPDITIKYGIIPDEIIDAKIKGVRYQAGPGEFLLKVDNVAKYYVTGGSDITIEPDPKAYDQEIFLFLMGSAMGALLHQRSILPLHGSSINIGGKGVIFAGPSSVGKSTLAAGFHKKGYPLLADDVCAITALNGNLPQIIPGFPLLKLWGDTLQKIDKDHIGLERVRPDQNYEKYFFPFSNPDNERVTVKSFFLLETTNTDEFNITRMTGEKKIDPLLENTYRPRFLEGLGGKKAHFMQCAAVAGNAEVFKVTRPKKGFKLNDLMAFVEKNF